MRSAADLQHQFHQMVRDSQFWPRKQMRDYQRNQLEQLIRHARATTPFYETRLDMLFDRRGDIDWKRWKDVPIVRRADMVQHREAMQARQLPPGHGPTAVMHTSGSTGQPLAVTVNALGAMPANAFRWRMHEWLGLDWSKTMLSRLGDGDHDQRHPDGEMQGPWGPPWGQGAAAGRLVTVSRLFDTATVHRHYRALGASYFNAGPNMAHINALDAERLALDWQIEAILVQGNVVRPADREACRRVFGAELIEHYSSKEAGQLAHPCPHGALHINAEGCLVEVLDEAGEPCHSGQTGRVVVTPFFQTAQPLIRYEQGDWATVGTCSCGRHLPVLAAVAGRSIAIFRHPDGRSVANLMPDETTSLLGSRYWQLAQTGPNEYELRYVPVDAGQPGDEAAVTALFRSTYFEDATLRFVRTSDIPPASGGKLVEYLNEWEQAAALS